MQARHLSGRIRASIVMIVGSVLAVAAATARSPFRTAPQSIETVMNSTGQANARIVADPGACVTIARQPPFLCFRSAPSVRRKSSPRTTAVACVSARFLLVMSAGFVTIFASAAARLDTRCGDCATYQSSHRARSYPWRRSARAQLPRAGPRPRAAGLFP